MNSGELIVVLDEREHRFAAGRPIRIGRAEDCDVVIADTRVSRYHLEVVDDGGWIVQDLDTGNGTWRDEVRVTAWPVGSGLEVRLGDPGSGPRLELIADDSGPAGTQDLDGAGRLESVEIGEMVTIGRADDNDMVLDDLLVSRWHARVVRTARGVLVQDLGSANLTFVNGDPVTAAVLEPGGMLTCGQTRMVRVGDRLHRLPSGAGAGLVVEELAFAAPAGGSLSSRLSFHLTGRSLMAVVGPAESGTGTLLELLAGDVRPTSGRIRYRSLDVQTNAAVRTQIGLVPEMPAIHPRRTVQQAMRDAAALRLPLDATPEERADRIAEVLAELDLTGQLGVRVARLRPDQVRRLAIGVELLAHPSLLLLDRPTSGLDPAQARSVMLLLRQLADAGRQVLFATSTPGDLGTCDEVLVLAPGGRQLFHGAPDDVVMRFGTDDWALIFERISDRQDVPAPDEPAAEPPKRTAGPAGAVLTNPAVRRLAFHQAGVVARRQAQLLATDVRQSVPSMLLPLVVAILCVAAAEGDGLNGHAATRPLTALIIGMLALGALPPLLNLPDERPVYLHERASGLLPEAYLAGKFGVFGALAAGQGLLTCLLVTVALEGSADAVLLGSPFLELAVGLTATAVAGSALGLAISALARTRDNVALTTLVTMTLQLLLCGGLVSLAGRPFLAVFALLTPGRWAYAVTASTSNVPGDVLWAHRPGTWALDLGMVVLLTAGLIGVTLWRLRR
ncbi:FHA domain-containing protein [Actinomadura fulvescens]|uniref:Uncharacterized protein n=1 Tax=Actinomadura fulvescens TaxID=46160 RepID=A0ABP6CBK2_9ACTN